MGLIAQVRTQTLDFNLVYGRERDVEIGGRIGTAAISWSLEMIDASNKDYDTPQLRCFFHLREDCALYLPTVKSCQSSEG